MITDHPFALLYNFKKEKKTCVLCLHTFAKLFSYDDCSYFVYDLFFHENRNEENEF